MAHERIIPVAHGTGNGVAEGPMTEPFSKQSGQARLSMTVNAGCVAAKNGLEQLRGESQADEVRLIPYQSEATSPGSSLPAGPATCRVSRPS